MHVIMLTWCTLESLAHRFQPRLQWQLHPLAGGVGASYGWQLHMRCLRGRVQTGQQGYGMSTGICDEWLPGTVHTLVVRW